MLNDPNRLSPMNVETTANDTVIITPFVGDRSRNTRCCRFGG